MADNFITSPNLHRVAAFAFLFVVFLSTTVFSSGGPEKLKEALEDLCCKLQRIVPVTAMLLVIAAGVIYSIGQMFGAETRARANVWATSCLTGAVIGILIAQVAPHVLGIIADATITCGAC